MIDTWFDKDGLMHLEPLPSDRPENAILYSVTNWLLYNNNNVFQIRTILKSLERGGVLYEEPQKKGPPTSHDNMTAIITMMVMVDMPIKHIKILPYYPHPRDIIYMGYLQRRWWAYLLLPALFIVFLWMALSKYKVRNGRKIFKTDTEILYWIRTQLPAKFRFIHATKRLIVCVLKRKLGESWVQSMMDIYYRNPNHPNRNHARQKEQQCSKV